MLVLTSLPDTRALTGLPAGSMKWNSVLKIE
jgi:hypothetical protein